MFCSKCGKECPDGAVVCLGCGCPIEGSKLSKSDSSAAGFGVLGFFFPLVGFILWLVWREDRPKRAKACGIGALISVGFSFLWAIVGGIIFSTLISTIISDLAMYGF